MDLADTKTDVPRCGQIKPDITCQGSALRSNLLSKCTVYGPGGTPLTNGNRMDCASPP